MMAKTLTITQRIYAWCFLACLAILPMSHTTALRNLLFVVLLLLLGGCAIARRRSTSEPIRLGFLPPWSLLAWCVFLLLFPLWAVYPEEAWLNLKGQWGQSIIAWIVGFGAVWMLGTRGPGLWALALASAFPLVVHLVFVLLAWVGLLGQPLPLFLSFKDAAARLGNVLVEGQPWPGLQPFPWGFWGVEDMHGNLGYAAGQAIALLSVLLLLGWRDRQARPIVAAAVAIVMCLVSLLVASSRGGLLYAVILIVISFLIYRWRWGQASDAPIRTRLKVAVWMTFLVAVVIVAGLAWRVASKDLRWQTMIDKVMIGLALDDPVRVLCKGLSPDQEQQIRQNYSRRDKAYVDNLILGVKSQDGGRILLMRVGVELVLEHPLGLDGSRGSYKKVIAQKCGHVPELTFAHLHQSWMDLVLALGWLGAILFAWLLLDFVWKGWTSMSLFEQRASGFALMLLAMFWFIRGFADSLYREHYLQMQAMLMSYLYGRIYLNHFSRN